MCSRLPWTTDDVPAAERLLCCVCVTMLLLRCATRVIVEKVLAEAATLVRAAASPRQGDSVAQRCLVVVGCERCGMKVSNPKRSLGWRDIICSYHHY